MSTPRTLVVSASRTKDLVRCSPLALARVLAGEQPCRFGRSGAPRPLDLDALHTLVLWTKDPAPMVDCAPLFAALQRLVQAGAQIYLQLTATAFGGAFVEHGVPTVEQLRGRLDNVLRAGLVEPDAVKLRYDPLLRVRAGRMRLTNLRREAFRLVLDAFLSLGVEDVVTSYVDAVRYPKVRRRIEARLGLQLEDAPDAEVRAFVRWMAEECARRGARFDTCASPLMPFAREGCISGTRLNELMARRFGADAPRCDARLHNEAAPGGQRAACRCTISRDIGYSAGFVTCYSRGTGCIYCYSCHESPGPRLLPKLLEEIAAFRSDPDAFLRQPEHAHYLPIVER